MKSKKVYIAGKISGDPNYKRKFQKAQEFIESKGGIVLNPAVLPEGMTKADYMRICFAMIDSADLVVFIQGYSESKGAILEQCYCEYIGKGTGLLIGEMFQMKGCCKC